MIGSNLVSSISNGWNLYGISRRKPKTPANVVNHISIDFSKEWDVSLLPEQVNAVIHLAQSEYFRDFPERAHETFKTNVESVVKLLEYARQHNAKTFILASSGGIYGYGDKEFSEKEPITSKGDLSFYLGTKLCSEIIAENYTQYMNIIILRFFFVYGPGQNKTMLIPRLIGSVLNNRPIALDGEDGIRINPTYVSDAVDAICRSLLLCKSQKINIGGPEVLSLKEIGKTIGSLLKKKPCFSINDEIEPRNLIGDIQKMSKRLNAPIINLNEGIRRTINKISNREII